MKRFALILIAFGAIALFATTSADAAVRFGGHHGSHHGSHYSGHYGGHYGGHYVPTWGHHNYHHGSHYYPVYRPSYSFGYYGRGVSIGFGF